MTRLARRRLFLQRLSELVGLLSLHNIHVIIFAFYRTAEEQKRLYEEGKSKCDGYTVRSKHQDWLAVDLGIITDDGKDILWTDDRYAKLGELAEGVGLVWGGSWNAFGGGDVYHVELCDDI